MTFGLRLSLNLNKEILEGRSGSERSSRIVWHRQATEKELQLCYVLWLGLWLGLGHCPDLALRSSGWNVLEENGCEQK